MAGENEDKFDLIFDSPTIRAYFRDLGSNEIFLQFPSYKPDRRGFEEARVIPFLERAKKSYIALVANRNHWFLTEDLQPFTTAAKPIVLEYNRREAFGFSMGGTGAFAVSKALDLHRVVAASPFAYAAIGTIPHDERLLTARRKIDPQFDLMHDYIKSDLEGIIIYDWFVELDRFHRETLREMAPKLRGLTVNFSGHGTMKVIREQKQAGAFGNCLILKNHNEAKGFKDIYRRARRNSPFYLNAVSQYLEKREESRNTTSP